MSALDGYAYAWPREEPGGPGAWSLEPGGRFRVRALPESAEELRADSRWPAFFPSPLCLVSTANGRRTALEKVVGASIVNRFPYVAALSFCRQALSARHHVRGHFMETLEAGGCAALQFLPPGAALDRAMHAVLTSDESTTAARLSATGLPVRSAHTNPCPVFEDAYMVCEARLVRPARDFDGRRIFERPWLDVGSHRVYFLEINAIQLREDVARGQSQIRWRSLPLWAPRLDAGPAPAPAVPKGLAYQKGFTADYAFPSANTVAFEADEFADGRAIKHLPPLAGDQVEVDNDRARWPCFFPSSVGMITSQAPDGPPNLMPCGSTTVLSRHPLVIAPCVSYAAINRRYAPRASLEIIRRTGRFGCGVPYLSDRVLTAIRYAGNVSLAHDPDKIANAGLTVDSAGPTPRLAELPVHYDCELIGEVPLGTHSLFLGEVRRVSVRADVTPTNPIRWIPWADAPTLSAKELCA